MKWVVMIVLIIASYILFSKFYIDTPCLRECKVSYEKEISFCRTGWTESGEYENMSECIQDTKDKRKSCMKTCGKKE